MKAFSPIITPGNIIANVSIQAPLLTKIESPVIAEGFP
jgi:hypothetical protein